MSIALRHTRRTPGDGRPRREYVTPSEALRECEELRRSNEEKDTEIEELMLKMEELADAVITAEGCVNEAYSSGSDLPMMLSSQESDSDTGKRPCKEPVGTQRRARVPRDTLEMSEAALKSRNKALRSKNHHLQRELERAYAAAEQRVAERDQAETLCLEYANSTYRLEKLVGLLERDTRLLKDQVKNGTMLVEVVRDLVRHKSRVDVPTYGIALAGQLAEWKAAGQLENAGSEVKPAPEGTPLDMQPERSIQLADAERRMLDARAVAAEHSRRITELEAELRRLHDGTCEDSGPADCQSTSEAEHSSGHACDDTSDKETFSNPEDHIASLRKRLSFAQRQHAQAELTCRTLSHLLEESEKRAKRPAEPEYISLMQGNVQFLRSQVEDGAELTDSATMNLSHYAQRVQELTENLRCAELQRHQSERLAFPFFSTLERMESTLEQETRKLVKALKRIKQLESEQNTLDSCLLSKSKTLAKYKRKVTHAKTIAEEHERTIKQLEMQLWRAQTTLPTSDEIMVDNPAPVIPSNTPTPKSMSTTPVEACAAPYDLFPAGVSESFGP